MRTYVPIDEMELYKEYEEWKSKKNTIYCGIVILLFLILTILGSFYISFILSIFVTMVILLFWNPSYEEYKKKKAIHL